MSLYAVDAIDDALSATRSFLWPFDRGRWLRLALVVFFVGGAGGFPSFQFSGGAPTGTGPGTSLPPGLPSPEAVVPGVVELLLIAGVFALIAAIVFGLLFVGSVMEFVFVESLRREAVSVRRYWRDNWRVGARLFGFRLLLGVLTLAVVLSVLAVALSPVFLGNERLVIGTMLLAIPVFFAVAVVSGLLGAFTTNFVVPIMLVEDRGVLAAWRRFWPTLTAQWKQYAAYVVISFVLQIAVGIVTSIVVVLGAIVAAVPFGIVGLAGGALLSVSQIAGGILIAVAAVLFVLTIIVLGLLVAVPVTTYLRYYALLVLGDTNAEFDLIADRRRAIRES
jgi:hypothetical protein